MLRTAFDAAIQDPDLLEEAKKPDLEINPRSGKVFAGHVQKLYSATNGLVERMAKVIRP